VYLPSEGGKKGKEIKVDYFDDQREAWEACKRERVKHGLPETAWPVKVAGADAGAGAAESAAPALPPGGGAADASPPDASDTDAGEEEHR
jgi:hypothetical protein